MDIKLNKNVILTGMMGVGKTTIGRNLANKLSFKFIDIDTQIERREKSTINNIFKKNGEVYFRKIEAKITLLELKNNSSVISLGGGTFMNKKVRKEILDNHLSFWLHWDDKILVERIKNSSKRPVAFQASNDELLNLIKKRSSIYSKARYKIDCNNLTKIEIVEKVVKNL